MITVLDWLDSKMQYVQRDKTVNVPILEVLTELIVVNGGTMEVKSWGKIMEGGLYGRSGLTLEEAMLLIRLSSMADGFLLCQESIPMRTAFQIKIQQEIDRIKKLVEAGGEAPLKGQISLIEIATEADLKQINKVKADGPVVPKRVITG